MKLFKLTIVVIYLVFISISTVNSRKLHRKKNKEEGGGAGVNIGEAVVTILNDQFLCLKSLLDRKRKDFGLSFTEKAHMNDALNKVIQVDKNFNPSFFQFERDPLKLYTSYQAIQLKISNSINFVMNFDQVYSCNESSQNRMKEFMEKINHNNSYESNFVDAHENHYQEEIDDDSDILLKKRKSHKRNHRKRKI